jgi:hypothetical protein
MYTNKILIFIKFIIFDIPLFLIVYILAMIVLSILSVYKTIKNSNHAHWFKSFRKTR